LLEIAEPFFVSLLSILFAIFKQNDVSMLVKIYPENPNEKEIRKVVDVLRNGGLVIYPTDTIYGIGCDINNAKAVEKVARIKDINLKKANLSFICYDLSHISDFTKPLNNHVFKLMKKHLPGPFTFILPANSNVPKLFKNNKKTIGIRVPDNNIIRELVKELGNPILSTSVRDEDDIIEYTTDPELIYEKFADQVDVVIDGGYGDNEPSTIVDCTSDELELVRYGKGEIEL
jgi:tRNA threonylcarbamoyl adenosine modification protein (Sua5/YciO/YrdC/YwlC family)